MNTLNRRLAELEKANALAVTLESSSADLCRHLARTPFPTLMAELDLDETERAELLAEVREHVPGYGVTQ